MPIRAMPKWPVMARCCWGASSGNTNIADVWVCRGDNTLLTSFWVGGNLQNRQLKVSGDGMVGIVLVGGGETAAYGTPYIKFMPIGPDSSASGKLQSGAGAKHIGDSWIKSRIR